jgi:hypothetical protein
MDAAPVDVALVAAGPWLLLLPWLLLPWMLLSWLLLVPWLQLS